MKYLIIIVCLIPSIILGGTLDMSFYGDKQRWWVGTVEEDCGQTDPAKLGRCKVRIDGIHGSDISSEDNDLPYAQVIMPATGGGTSGIGDTPQLVSGARVIGFFLDGVGSQIPVIWGFLPHSLGPSGIQRQNIAKQQSVINEFFDENGFQQQPIHVASHAGLDNITQAWNFFAKNSRLPFQAHHIAGMIGNFMVETGDGTIKGGINPKALNPTKEASFGIAQWNPGGAGKRLHHLKRWAASPTMQGDYQDLLIQLNWVVEELITEPYHNNNFISNAKTTTQAALHFMRNYEMPQFFNRKTKFFTVAQGGKFRGKGVDLEQSKEVLRISAAKAVYIKYSQAGKHRGVDR